MVLHLKHMTQVEGALGALPSTDEAYSQVEQYTKAAASMHAKITSLEAENKKLLPAMETLKRQMADISIELGHWKEKANAMQGRVDSFDRDAMHMRTLNAELGVCVCVCV